MTAENGGFRFADGRYDSARERVVLVRETENDAPSKVVNQVVSMAEVDAADQVVVASGADFYSYPRLSPDGGPTHVAGGVHMRTVSSREGRLVVVLALQCLSICVAARVHLHY